MKLPIDRQNTDRHFIKRHGQKRSISAFIVVAAVAVTCFVSSAAASPVAPASSATNNLAKMPTASYFQFINRASGKCLTPWGTGDGTAITQVPCNGSTGQKWLVDLGSPGPISNHDTAKCLDLFGNNSADGQLVFTWSCQAVGYPNQMWKPLNVGGQYYELHQYFTNKCLDVLNGFTTTGAIIQQWGCHIFNDNQQWQIVP